MPALDQITENIMNPGWIICIACVLAGCGTDEPTSEEESFIKGMNFGHVSGLEGSITDCVMNIRMAETLEGELRDDLIDINIMRINTTLHSISGFVNTDIPRNRLVRYLHAIKETNTSTFMKSLADMRIEKGWQDKDPEVEKLIQMVLNNYIETGNAFGIMIKD